MERTRLWLAGVAAVATLWTAAPAERVLASTPAACAPAPLGGCATPTAALLKLRAHADPGRRRLAWSWRRGSASRDDFGDPAAGTTGYRLCVYGDGSLATGPAVAGGGTCDGDACWSARGATRLVYENRAGNADGVTRVLLKSGLRDAGLVVKGSGANLSAPLPLADSLAVTVQLVVEAGSASRCWGATFPAPAARNDGGRFVARTKGRPQAGTIPSPVAGFTISPSDPAAGQTVTFTDGSSHAPTSWSWAFGDGGTSALQNPTHVYAAAGSYTVTLTAANAAGSSTATRSLSVVGDGGPGACETDPDCAAAGACPPDAAMGCACSVTPRGRRCVPRCTIAADCPTPPDQTLVCTDGLCVPGDGPAPDDTMDIDDTVSDQAQSATIAFDGLAFVTGSFCAQTFYPPGKVADFFGFQYLRDNDPSHLGHNTEFTTLSADPVLAVLSEAQVDTFVALAEQEQQLSDDYGHARFPLAMAFRRLIDGDAPLGHPDLGREAVKAYSASLFAIDGEMSFLRARAYAGVLGSMDASQRAVLDAMKGHGAAEWQQPATEPAALRNHGAYSVQLRTYAGEMLAWYVGSADADVYFCPERQGTYFGSFFMKDIKAMHNPNYTIDSNMTADMGDAFLATLDPAQRSQVTGLVAAQKPDLLAIVAKRDEISARLRALLVPGGVADEAAVVGLARQYGELDGEISYLYATSFSAVGTSLTQSQRAALTALRKTATAEDDGSADYDAQCGNGYLYSAPLPAPPAVMDTDFLFGVCEPAGGACSTDWDCCSFSCREAVCAAPFALTSTAFQDGGTLPVAYTCDDPAGGVSPPLAWSGVPAGTAELALTMTTIALDGTRWNWVLFHIPASVTSLAPASVGVGTAGVSSDGPELRYYPPCSTGPGDKTYTFTIHALSAAPTFTVPESQVDGEILASAIAPVTIASRTLSVGYARSGP